MRCIEGIDCAGGSTVSVPERDAGRSEKEVDVRWGFCLNLSYCVLSN